MSSPISCEISDGIAILRINDGKANAWSFAMMEAMAKALDDAEAANAAVVLTGRPGMFSAGFDLTVIKKGGGEITRMLQMGTRLINRLLKFPRPVVAAVSGHAVAMGAMSLLACDFRIGIAGDYRVQLNETQLGIAMPYVGLALGRHRLALPHQGLAMTCARAYTTEAAISAGYLDEIVQEADFESAAMARARELAQLDAKAFAETKRRMLLPIIGDIAAAQLMDDAAFKLAFG